MYHPTALVQIERIVILSAALSFITSSNKKTNSNIKWCDSFCQNSLSISTCCQDSFQISLASLSKLFDIWKNCSIRNHLSFVIYFHKQVFWSLEYFLLLFQCHDISWWLCILSLHGKMGFFFSSRVKEESDRKETKRIGRKWKGYNETPDQQALFYYNGECSTSEFKYSST